MASRSATHRPQPEDVYRSHPIPPLPLFDDIRPEPRFNGPAYSPEHDQKRLTGQLLRIFNLMKDGGWRTLGEIAQATDAPQASISAQLRHLRKAHFGAHTVERRARGEREHGLFEYRVMVNGGKQ